MTSFVESLERRSHPRVRRHLACKLLVGGQTRRGVVRDLSAGGLFVWTRRPPASREPVVISFDAPQGERFVLEASAPRRSLVPHSLASVALPGVALSIEDPPQGYLRWVTENPGAAS